MEVKQLCLLMLAVVAFGSASAQSDDEPIPVENDNQFPPDNQAAADDDGGTIQGSGDGDGTLQEPEEPTSTTTESLQGIPLEEIQPTHQLIAEMDKTTDNGYSCPTECLCTVEGPDFVADCSGKELTEFPSGFGSETTKLKIQNNKLKEIPKQISMLQKLYFLNASSNSIADLASGTISELHNLVILDLRNNRLIEYPQDLKNSYKLIRLEELHLEGNDMRTELGPDTFVMFTALAKIILPSSAYKEQVENTLCKSLKDSLKLVCVETCDPGLICTYGPDVIDNENEMLDAKIPGAIYSDNNNEEEYVDPTLSSPNASDSDTEIKSGDNESPLPLDTSTNDAKEVSNTDTNSASRFSLRGEFNNEPENPPENIAKSSNEELGKIDAPVVNSRFNAFVEAPKEESPKTDSDTASRVDGPSDENKNNADYKLGAKTSESSGGGVDKSVIGMVVAGMVVIVAGITIKKNWSSIRKKFSSNSRTPNDRPAGNANGTTPEEVPLQDKSPV